jgi:hypothetical protein
VVDAEGSHATWSEFEAAEPEAARSGRDLLQLGLAYLGTVRRSGFPRITPISPVFAGGRIWATVVRSTPKCAELASDGRYALHALPGPEQQEFALTGTAIAADDADTRELLRASSEEQGVVWDDQDAVFELRIASAFWAEYSTGPNAELVATRRIWKATSSGGGGETRDQPHRSDVAEGAGGTERSPQRTEGEVRVEALEVEAPRG